MGQSTEELTSEIAGTRQKMASDLDALQDRVSPAAIVERRKTAAKSKVSSLRDKVMGTASNVHSTASTHTSNVAGGVQGAAQGVAGRASDAASATQGQIVGSPLAAGLVAFGAGMVIAGMFPASNREAQAASTLIDTAQDKGAPLLDKAKSLGQEMGEDLKQTATDAAMQVKDTAQESAARVKDEGQSAAETVKSEAQSDSGSSQGGQSGISSSGTQFGTGSSY